MIPDPNYIRWQFQPRLQCRAMKGQWIIFSSSLTAVYWMSLSYWYVVKTVLEKNKNKKNQQITQRKSESSVCSRKNRWYILDWIFSWKVCRLVVIAGKLRFIWNVKKYLCFCPFRIGCFPCTILYETLLRLSLKWLYWSMIVVQIVVFLFIGTVLGFLLQRE